MPFTKEFEFPSDEELTTTEVNISLSALRAGAIHFGKYCERENNVSFVESYLIFFL